MRKTLFVLGVVLFFTGLGAIIGVGDILFNYGFNYGEGTKSLSNRAFFAVMFTFIFFTLGVYLMNTNKPKDKD